MNGLIKGILITLAVLVVSIVAFILVIGTTGRNGAVAMAVDNVIASVNANVARVTGIAQLLPYINPDRGATTGAGVGDDGYNEAEDSGADGATNAGMWN